MKPDINPVEAPSVKVVKMAGTRGRAAGGTVGNDRNNNEVEAKGSNTLSKSRMGLTYKLDGDGRGNEDLDSNCGECSKIVKNNEKGIQCDMCEMWYHSRCGGINNETYAVITATEGIDWYCSKCKKMSRLNTLEIVRLDKENKELKGENELLKGRLAVLESRIDEIKQELRNEIMADVNKQFTEVMENMKESEERKSKENNLVLFNVKEPDGDDDRSSERKDRDNCDKIFTQGVGLRASDYNITTLYRLGKKNRENDSGKPRPLLVKLERTEQKWNILKNAKNLAREEGELKRCIIAPDLTRKEREIDFRLRTELRRKRENGESGWFIKSGKLIKRNF